jgi:HEAT repeat protein
VEALTKLLKDPDTQVAQASARALGKIGNPAAAKALQDALPNTPAANQLDFYEGLFRCAESLASEGQKNKAIEIYDQLRKPDLPHQVRGGALRGATLTHKKEDGIKLLSQQLRSNDYILFSAAVQAAQELPYTEVTSALTAELSSLPADNQILVIQTLGKRCDPAALSSLFDLARNSTKPVRIASIQALPAIGHASAIPTLLELLDDADRQIARTAQESFAAIPGREVDSAVMAMLNSSRTSQKLTALELIGRRRMITSIPKLLEIAKDANPQVRPAALKKLGELGTLDELPTLLDLLMDFAGKQDLNATEQALSDICVRTGKPNPYTTKLIGTMDKANPAQKSALLRILCIIGETNALMAVRTAVESSNTQVRDTAIRVLCAWKTTDAAPDLLTLAKKAPSQSHKTAALRGYIRLAKDESLPTRKKLDMCKEAAALARRDEEKRFLLSAVGMVPTTEALSMAISHLSNSAVKLEACFAAIAISEKIVKQNPEEVTEAMQKVMKATNNKNVIRRTRAILSEIR